MWVPLGSLCQDSLTASCSLVVSRGIFVGWGLLCEQVGIFIGCLVSNNFASCLSDT